MRFSEIFARRTRPVISFEVFPPKTDAAMESFRAVLPRLVALAPDYMTVTYGALGSTQGRTLEIAALIKGQHRLETACHLTCVGSDRDAIGRILDGIARTGIENIVALRGDPPQGQKDYVPPPGGYRHAIELVELIRRRGGFGIAVAGYPEKHIEAPSLESDLAHLGRKVQAGGDVVVTQLFYDNAHYFRFVELARERGVRVPIVPGLLPIVSLQQVKRLTSMCGASIPDSLLAALEDAGPDEQATLAAGVRHAVDQAKGLLEGGAPGIHFYVLNRFHHMERILSEIRPILDSIEKSGQGKSQGKSR